MVVGMKAGVEKVVVRELTGPKDALHLKLG